MKSENSSIKSSCGENWRLSKDRNGRSQRRTERKQRNSKNSRMSTSLISRSNNLNKGPILKSYRFGSLLCSWIQLRSMMIITADYQSQSLQKRRQKVKKYPNPSLPSPLQINCRTPQSTMMIHNQCSLEDILVKSRL